MLKKKKKSAFEEERKQEDEEVREEKASDDIVDSEHVNELSDLFSTIENEFGDCDSSAAIDFSVLLEGEHAFNVEEVSEIFSDLEDAATAVSVDITQQDVDDAAVVDEMAALFSGLEDMEQDDVDETVDTDSDGDSTEGNAVVDAADERDAENVDDLSDLFSALEEKEDQQTSQDWIAALDVDDVSVLYSELEQLQQKETTATKPVSAVDPRIFVPTFSVRMESRAGTVPLHRVPTPGAFLAGPPGLFLAGPPVRKSGVSATPIVRSVPNEHKQEKRKLADPSISATRRVCAAKRRRVNGRFVREQNSFVSITSLQPTSQ